MAYMNLVTPGQKSGGLLAKKEKDFDWGMFNPLEFKGFGGERKFNPKGAYNKFTDYFFGDDDDDSEVRHYTQTGGDAGGLEELYKQQGPGMKRGMLTSSSPLPTGSGEAVAMPEFIKSQMKSYKDPETSGRQEEEKRVLARMALAQQTPSLAPEEASWLDKILGQDKGSELAHVGGSLATVKTPKKGAENFPNIVKQETTPASEGGSITGPISGKKYFLNKDGIYVDEDGKGGKELGFQIPQKVKLNAQGEFVLDKSTTAKPSDDYDVSGDDDMGFATQSTAPTSGLLAQSGDSSGSEGMSVGKMQALLKVGELLSGGTAQDQPAQRAQILPVMRGSTPNFASTKKPQRQYFRPRGLGQPFDYA